MKISHIIHGAAPALLFSLAACQAEPPPTPSNGQTGGPPLSLPISYNALMLSTIDHDSDYLWAIGNGDMPKNDHDWAQLRDHAYQTIVSGKVIQLPGTGSNDVQWLADPQWVKYAEMLSAVGEHAVRLAEAKNADKAEWEAVRDEQSAACEGCHKVFKPNIPTQGMLHEPFDPDKHESVFR